MLHIPLYHHDRLLHLFSVQSLNIVLVTADGMVVKTAELGWDAISTAVPVFSKLWRDSVTNTVIPMQLNAAATVRDRLERVVAKSSKGNSSRCSSRSAPKLPSPFRELAGLGATRFTNVSSTKDFQIDLHTDNNDHPAGCYIIWIDDLAKDELLKVSVFC
jgi:hypothetical protein